MNRLVLALCLFSLSVTPAAVPASQNTKALLLFGGSDHKTFLGCLNCVDTSSVSVCNDVGEYGSDIAENSIWNDIGTFGSDISPLSPWDDISDDALIIVDSDGSSYGYLSTNTLHHDRTRIQWLVAILDYYEKTSDLSKTRTEMCGD